MSLHPELPRLALSIRQPWVWAILSAGKDIENRGWSTKFRGEFAIHVSKGMTKAEYEDFLETVHHISLTHPFADGLTLPAFADLDRGGIVGVASIVDCVDDHPSPWFFGSYGLVLADVRSVSMIPVKGALGFFDWRKNL